MKLNINKIFRNDYVVVFLFDLIGKIIVGVQSIIVIRLLCPSDYAQYTNFIEIGGLVLSIIGTGLSIPFVTNVALERSNQEAYSFKLYRACCLGVLILSISFLAFLPLFREIYKLSFVSIVIALVYGCAQSLTKMSQSYYQSINKFRISGIILNIRNIILFIVIVLLYFIVDELPFRALIIVSACAVLVSFLVGDIIISKNQKEQYQIPFKNLFGDLLNLVKESKWLIGHLILTNFFSSICLLMLNIVGTEIDVANYGVANKYYQILMLFLASLQTVLRVKTCDEKFISDDSYRRNYIKKWTIRAFLLSSIIAILGIVISPWALSILNGDGYDSAIPIFQVLLISVVLGYTFSINTVMMISLKKEKILFFNSIICLFISGALCYTLYPIIGAISAAISITVSNGLLNIISFVIIMKKEER